MTWSVAGPDTSREAARSIDVTRSEVCLSVLRAMVEVDRANGGSGATCHEIVQHLTHAGGWQAPNCVASRLNDLHHNGFVYDTGERRPGATNRRMIVWRPSPNGCEQVAA